MLLFRKYFVAYYIFFQAWKHSEHPYYTSFQEDIPTFALLFQNFEPYFIPPFSMEGTWKPMIVFLTFTNFW